MNENIYPKRRKQSILSNLNSDTLRSNERAIKILRTAFWYEHLCQATSLRTPYKLGKHLQPETYRKSIKGVDDADLDPFHHNLWHRYAGGHVIPSQALINRVNANYSGSKAFFDHPLFDTLNIHKPIGQNATKLLKMLPPRVQQAVFENKSLLAGGYLRSRSIVKTLKLLERCGNLDALAAIIILYREAIENKEHELGFRIAESLFHTSIIACTLEPGSSIRSELGIMLVCLIFPLIESNGRVHTTNYHHFINCCTLLKVTILMLEDDHQIGLKFEDTHTAICKVFRGECGFELFWALQSTTACIADNSKATSKIQEIIKCRQFYSDRAWNTFKSGELHFLFK